MKCSCVLESLIKLKIFIEKHQYQGYDPYDALNSPLLQVLTLNRKYLRIATIQSLKRLPVNIRPFLGIRKGYNPKGLGLLLWGYAKLFVVNKKLEYLEKVGCLTDLLDKLRSEDYSGNCWGYNFDWQSRAFFVPKYTPTIVNSSFIGHALLDTHEINGNQAALDLAIPIKDFILNDLNRKQEGSTLCFSYTPIDTTAVHNANLLGASLLIRLYGYTKDDELKEIALSSLAYSMKYQRIDGSWFYAETDFQRWIDSFHTGFNLQSILYFLEEGFGEEYRDGFERGVRFYANNFFLKDGTPKYYHDKTYPIDIHSAAQAIVFFSRMGGQYRELADRITHWMITNMQDKKGYFYFQKHRFYTNRIPYMRWSQAWAFHALTEHLLNQQK
ncbi:MAG: delta-aminolevulinic acid dehydratase [Deltaproteobacteria bacterium]|nr:delta-aminolevulinic acid dehydratase [Deltaproteobacteria bacterium]